MESTFEKIIRKTGAKPSACKCETCKSACKKTPGLCTPEDATKIVAAGLGDKLAGTEWLAGVLMGVHNESVKMMAPNFDEEKGHCSFFENGLCTLHDLGLKPTECRLSHHSIRRTNLDPKKSISWQIAKEWINITTEETQRLITKYKI